ncbi:MAG: hypothetical protein JNG90_11830 [Planctomycetaceae bacterium]|nr:hypothetical protein [Planctomycetaceae bacterium]
MFRAAILTAVVSATALALGPDQAEGGIFCCHRGWYCGGYPACYTPCPPCGWPYWAEPGCGMPRNHCCGGLFGWLFHCHHKHRCWGPCYGIATGGYCSDGSCIEGSYAGGGYTTDGCVDGNCGGQVIGDHVVGESSGDSYGGEHIGKEEVIYDGPAAGAPQINSEPVEAPAAVDSAAMRRAPHRLASYRRQVNASFEKGLALYREHRLSEAANEFEAAATADPANALYLYHTALTMYDQYGAEAAADALQRAIQAERRQPVANWGQAMERIQGQGRLWIEKARRDAGLVR